MQKMASTSVKSVADLIPYTELYEWPIGHRIKDCSVPVEIFDSRLEIFHNHIKEKTLTRELVSIRSAKWITFRNEETGDFLGSIIEYEDDFQREVLQPRRKKSEDDMVVPQKAFAPRSRSRKTSSRLIGKSNLPIEHGSITKRPKKREGFDETSEDDEEVQNIINGQELAKDNGDIKMIVGGQDVDSELINNTGGETSKISNCNNDTADRSLNVTDDKQINEGASGSNSSTPSPRLVIDESSTSEEKRAMDKREERGL